MQVKRVESIEIAGSELALPQVEFALQLDEVKNINFCYNHHYVWRTTFISTTLTKAFEHVQQEVRTLRTGRASADILDPVRVEAYGSSMRLVEVASVTAPDATLLVVSPWDKSLVGAVEKAIASAGLNLNPVVEGQIIRIAVPPLTQERRQEMVKLLHQKLRREEPHSEQFGLIQNRKSKIKKVQLE